MATWKAINSLRSTWDPSIQARIDQAFRAESCHLGIFGVDCVTMWCFLPPCISWISLMFDGAAASLPFWGFPPCEKHTIRKRKEGSARRENTMPLAGKLLKHRSRWIHSSTKSVPRSGGHGPMTDEPTDGAVDCGGKYAGRSCRLKNSSTV
jgi:hypothetical protein